MVGETGIEKRFKSRTERISENLRKKIELIQRSLGGKLGINISFATASEILSQRIDGAGGLRA